MTSPKIPQPDLVGTWLSIYEYPSSSCGAMFTDSHAVRVTVDGDRLLAASLPAPGSVLEMDLTVTGWLVTGTWRERSDPEGFYRGHVFTGAVQFIVATDRQSMAGAWVGASRDLGKVNTGTWTMTLIEGAVP